MAAVPSIGRAVHVEGAPAPEADLTRALYEQYANQIFRYCLHQLGSREEAEDAVQSTFLNAFRGIKRGIVPELESAWLFKIAHNVCLSRRRTTWRRGRIESPADFELVEELTPAPSRRADELMGLQDVLEQMPETQRRAILLREWQGLSYREIADELELSQSAVETLIFRARRSLAAGLEQPPERKRRLVRGADLGNLLAGLKTVLLGGGAAAKVAATVAVVSASTVVAAAPVQQLEHPRSHAPAKRIPAAADALPAQSSGAPAVATSSGPAAAFPGVAPKRHAPARAVKPVAPLARTGGPLSGAAAGADPIAVEPAPAPVAVPPPAAPPAPPPAPAASEPAPAPAPVAPSAPAPLPAQTASADRGAQDSAKGGSSSDKGQGGDKGRAADKGGNDAGRSKQSTPVAPVAAGTGAPTLPVPPAPASGPPAATPPVTTPAPAGGSDSKGNDSKGNDSKRNGSDKKSGTPAPAPPATAPAPVVASPQTVVLPAQPTGKDAAVPPTGAAAPTATAPVTAPAPPAAPAAPPAPPVAPASSRNRDSGDGGGRNGNGHKEH